MKKQKLEPCKRLPWNSSCIYVGSKFSKVVNENKKNIENNLSLNYYCYHCPYIEECRKLLGEE